MKTEENVSSVNQFNQIRAREAYFNIPELRNILTRKLAFNDYHILKSKTIGPPYIKIKTSREKRKGMENGFFYL